MSEYRHPYKDAEFVINELAEFDKFCSDANLEDINSELATIILTEAGKLGADVISPLNIIGDTNGAQLTEKGVQQTPGFDEAYQQFSANGWQSLLGPEDFGGQNLPGLLGTAVSEIWQSANLAFSLISMLNEGAISAVTRHGSDEIKQIWLPKMIEGSWTGTMNLTEPDAGTDLAAIKSKAIPEDDHYRISGQKIFISWGDHQMTDNIVHLVLARLPDAPVGARGISLFLVPKYLLDENENVTKENNDVNCVSLEHKLGIHASSTCVMSFGDNEGAIGYLIGEENNGLVCMFTMMNHARQGVGLQGLALSERSYQQALAFAKERIQGSTKDGTAIPIIKYPDVRRMLMLMKSSIEAMRALAYVASAENDLAKYAIDDTSRTKHKARAELYTPIVKGWLTELAQEMTSHGIQIHGGMGFIEETGSAQYYRDARILTIYEGTTGIQGLDLVGRKTLSNKGEHLKDLLEEMQGTVNQLETNGQFSALADDLKQAVEIGQQARSWLLDNSQSDPLAAPSVGVNLLMLYGYICGGWLMAKSALKAQSILDTGEGDTDFLNTKLKTTHFYFDHLLPRIFSHMEIIKSGSDSIMSVGEDQF